MKKTLVALAVMAAAGTAAAQSSVTLFGVVDLAVTYGRGDLGDRLSLTSGAYNTSRLGVRGVEDLGGGLQASFWLEAGINADSGVGQATSTNNQAETNNQGLAFNRRSTVSLAGNFGEVRLGRDYTPAFWNFSVFDPFGTVGVGASQAHVANAAGVPAVGTRLPIDAVGDVTAVRASNMIQYLLPRNLGGFYGQAAYYLGENLSDTATEDDGTGYGLRVGYAAGPFDVAIGYGNTELNSGDITTFNIGGSYNFGMAKVLAMWSRTENDTLRSELDGWLLGVSAPMGAGEIRASYSQSDYDVGGAEPKARKFAVGYVHNLSKRTAVYTTIAHLRNRGGLYYGLGGAVAGVNDRSTGFDLGVRHAF